MTITALPTPPSRQDPTNFAARADAFLGALPTFANEVNAELSFVNENIDAIQANAANITSIQNAAANAALVAGAVDQVQDGVKDRFVHGVDYTANTTTQLTISSTPLRPDSVQIFFSGVYQEKTTYSLNGNLITFTAAIPAASVEVVYDIGRSFAELDAAVAAADADAATASASAASASASASNAATSANNAASAVVSQLNDIKSQTEYIRDQALAGLGAANAQTLSELLGAIAYVTDMALKGVDQILENRGTVGSTDRAELYARMFGELLEKIGVIGRAVAGGAITLRAGTAAIPSLANHADVDTGLFFPSADAIAVAIAGLEALRVTADRRVGIGTTAPTGLLDVADNKLRVRTAQTPASATAAGNQGEIAWDASYIYVCTATNTWRRAAIGSW